MSSQPDTAERCVLCAASSTGQWTIGDGVRATVLELCSSHAWPLEEALEAGLAHPVRTQIRRKSPAGPIYRVPRSFEVLDWAPPSSPQNN